MANNCCIDMKIVGKEEAVKEFILALRHEGPYKGNGLGRVFSFDADDSMFFKDPRPGSDLVSVIGFGDCAWSVKSSMTNDSASTRTLESETKRLGICVDVYSSEPGMQFQEHYLIDRGEVIEDECVDYTEIFIETDDEKQIATLMETEGITREELFENINDNGDYVKGGFGEQYGDFQDLFSFFEVEPSKKIPLEEQINAAKNQNVSADTIPKQIEPER